MSELLKKAAPGLALAGVAVGLVAGFDRALRPATTDVTTVGTSVTDSTGASCDTAPEVTGDSVTTRWGPVQVVARVTDDGTVCDSEAVVYPDGDGRSQQINAYALPIIDEAVLEQGVAFDTVTGATVTSDGYRASLQSILDSL